jgi:hypothetical protein
VLFSQAYLIIDIYLHSSLEHATLERRRQRERERERERGWSGALLVIHSLLNDLIDEIGVPLSSDDHLSHKRGSVHEVYEHIVRQRG